MYATSYTIIEVKAGSEGKEAFQRPPSVCEANW